MDNIEIGQRVTVKDQEGTWVCVSKDDGKIQLSLLHPKHSHAIEVDLDEIES